MFTTAKVQQNIDICKYLQLKSVNDSLKDV